MSLNKIHESATEDNLLSREELIKLKNSIKAKYTPSAIAERKKSVILTNVHNPKLSKTVESISPSIPSIPSLPSLPPSLPPFPPSLPKAPKGKGKGKSPTPVPAKPKPVSDDADVTMVDDDGVAGLDNGGIRPDRYVASR